jgi:hypothetical protein
VGELTPGRGLCRWCWGRSEIDLALPPCEEEYALLMAVEGEPLELGVRGAYANWLAENGRVEGALAERFNI